MVVERFNVIFSAIDNMTSGLGRITGGLSGMTKQGLAMGAMFSLVNMGIQAVMKAIQALVKFVQEGIQAYVNFEKGLAEVSTLLSDTSPMESYREELRELAKDSGESLDTLTKGLYQTISASVDTGAAMDVLTVANKAAIAGISDTATAVDVITSIMNAYGMSASEATKISDYLFTAVKYGKTTFTELAAGVGPIITMSATLGIGFEEIAASLATMTRSGIQTTNAVTYLRGMLRSVLKPTDQMKNTARELGITFDGTTLKAKGLGGFLKYVSDAVGTNNEAMAKLFPNIRGIQAVFALAGENAEAFAGDLNNMANAGGATEIAFEKMANTTSFRLGQMRAEIKDTQLEIGERMVPASLAWEKAMLVLAGALGAIIDAIGWLWDVLKPVRDFIVAINKAFGALVITIKDYVIKYFEGLWALLKPLVEWLASTFKPVIDAIGGAIDAIAGGLGWLADRFGEAWDATQKWADEVLYGEKAATALTNALAHSEEEINEMAASLSEAHRQLTDLNANIETATDEISRLRDTNAELVDEIDRLRKIKVLSTDLELLTKSTKDATWAQEIFDNELRSAQIELLQTKALVEELEGVMDEYGDVTKKNNLEIMKIRHKARKEGRELTEEEEKLIEELELENESLRIKIEEEAIKIDEIQEEQLAEQERRVNDRKQQLKDERDALKEKAKDEIQMLQEELRANKRTIEEKLDAIEEWSAERRKVRKVLLADLQELQTNWSSEELEQIQTLSGLKLEEIDRFIDESERKWRNHYRRLAEMSGGEIVAPAVVERSTEKARARNQARQGPLARREGIRSMQTGGFIPHDMDVRLHSGEYVIPEKIVRLLDKLVTRQDTFTPIRRGARIKNINIYGDINLPNVTDYNSFMREFEKRARLLTGSRLV
jgi:TP901 family phage tail tape measure protein